MTTMSQDVEHAEKRNQAGRGRLLGLVSRVRELGLLIVLLLVIMIVGIQVPRFLSIDNFTQILLSVAILAIVAVGETLVVLTRNVDLSVGSIVGVSAFVTAYFFKQVPGANLLLVFSWAARWDWCWVSSMGRSFRSDGYRRLWLHWGRSMSIAVWILCSRRIRRPR